MEDGRSGGNHRAHVRLPDTQQRETNASVKTHNTVTQTRKQYSAQHNKMHGFCTTDMSSTEEEMEQLLNNLIASNVLNIYMYCIVLSRQQDTVTPYCYVHIINK